MHAFSKELYDTMGVRVFILGCYMKPDGTLYVSTYDFNQELVLEAVASTAGMTPLFAMETVFVVFYLHG